MEKKVSSLLRMYNNDIKEDASILTFGVCFIITSHPMFSVRNKKNI